MGLFDNAFDGIAGSALGAGLGFFGQSQSNDMAASSAKWAAQFNADFNREEAQKNRDWQKYMSNTAHRREVRDLRKAGLNPILSAMGGRGASVTSGATAASPGASKYDRQSPTAAGIEKALMAAQLKKLTAETDATQSSAKVAKIEATRKEKEFDAIDKAPASGKIVPYLEGLPEWLRGPLRAVAGAADSGYDLAEDIVKSSKGKSTSGMGAAIQANKERTAHNKIQSMWKQKSNAEQQRSGHKKANELWGPKTPWYDKLKKRWKYGKIKRGKK